MILPVRLAALALGLALPGHAPAGAELSLLQTRVTAALDPSSLAARMTATFRVSGQADRVSLWLLQPRGVDVVVARAGQVANGDRGQGLAAITLRPARSSAAAHPLRRSAVVTLPPGDSAAAFRDLVVELELELADAGRTSLPVPRLDLAPPPATPETFAATLELAPPWRLTSTLPAGWHEMSSRQGRYTLELPAAPSVLEFSLRATDALHLPADLALDLLALGLLGGLMVLGLRHLRRASRAPGPES